jgi:hypothetical protein
VLPAGTEKLKTTIMNKPTNQEKKSTSLTFEINPQLFWTILTAVIGVTFFLGFNFGKQTLNKEVANKDDQIKTIATDTQNVRSRLIDSLQVRVTFLDTETDSSSNRRVTQLRDQLKKFTFITTQRFGYDESLDKNIGERPAILIAHWHTYRKTGNNAHDEASEKMLLDTIQRYAEVNPAIRVIVFSSTFGDPNEIKRLTSKKISNLQNPISAFHLDPGNENKNEIATIVAKVLSTSFERIRDFSE